MKDRSAGVGGVSAWAVVHVVMLCGCGDAAGGLVSFPDPVSGDEGAGPGSARPVSEAVAGAFEAAALQVGNGEMHMLDFEAAPLGDFLSLAASDLGVSGVSILPAGGSDGNDSGIRGSASYSAESGYNTTLGGDLMMTLEEWGAGEPPTGVTFEFETPVMAFGAYFTGVDTDVFGAVRVSFENGTAWEYGLDVLSGGGAQFWGFVEDDARAGVRRVTVMIEPEFNPDPEFELDENQDVISIDDVCWVYVPEPETAVMVVLGVCCGFRRCRGGVG